MSIIQLVHFPKRDHWKFLAAAFCLWDSLVCTDCFGRGQSKAWLDILFRRERADDIH